MEEKKFLDILKLASKNIPWRRIQELTGASQYIIRNVIKLLHYSSVNKYAENVPKMYQKCTKNVPKNDDFENENYKKMYQKCTKNVPKMYQENSQFDELWILFLLFYYTLKQKNETEDIICNDVKEVIHYYNEITGHNIRNDPGRLLTQKIKAGYSVDDLKLVVALFNERTKLDPTHRLYYDPVWFRLDTLFRTSKFESNLAIAKQLYKGG